MYSCRILAPGQRGLKADRVPLTSAERGLIAHSPIPTILNYNKEHRFLLK